MKKSLLVLFPVLLLTLTSCGGESYTPVAKEQVPTKIAEYKGKLPENIKKASKTKAVSFKGELKSGEKTTTGELVTAIENGYLLESMRYEGGSSLLYQASFVKDDYFYLVSDIKSVIEKETKEVKSYVRIPVSESHAKFDKGDDAQAVNDYLVKDSGGGKEVVVGALDDLLADIADSVEGVSLEAGSKGGVKIVYDEEYIAFDSAARVVETYVTGDNVSMKNTLDYNAKFREPSLSSYKSKEEFTLEEAALETALTLAAMVDLGLNLLE